MSSKFKKGQFVRQVMPAPVAGIVTRIMLDEESGEFHYHVAAPAADGSLHDTSMPESALEAARPQDDPPVLTERVEIGHGDVGDLSQVA